MYKKSVKYVLLESQHRIKYEVQTFEFAVKNVARY